MLQDQLQNQFYFYILEQSEIHKVKNLKLRDKSDKETKDLYTGDCETALREAKGLEKWRDSPRLVGRRTQYC